MWRRSFPAICVSLWGLHRWSACEGKDSVSKIPERVRGLAPAPVVEAVHATVKLSPVFGRGEARGVVVSPDGRVLAPARFVVGALSAAKAARSSGEHENSCSIRAESFDGVIWRVRVESVDVARGVAVLRLEEASWAENVLSSASRAQRVLGGDSGSNTWGAVTSGRDRDGKRRALVPPGSSEASVLESAERSGLLNVPSLPVGEGKGVSGVSYLGLLEEDEEEEELGRVGYEVWWGDASSSAAVSGGANEVWIAPVGLGGYVKAGWMWEGEETATKRDDLGAVYRGEVALADSTWNTEFGIGSLPHTSVLTSLAVAAAMRTQPEKMSGAGTPPKKGEEDDQSIGADEVAVNTEVESDAMMVEEMEENSSFFSVGTIVPCSPHAMRLQGFRTSSFKHVLDALSRPAQARRLDDLHVQTSLLRGTPSAVAGVTGAPVVDGKGKLRGIILGGSDDRRWILPTKYLLHKNTPLPSAGLLALQPHPNGIQVVQVAKHSPAYQAGLRAGDVIQSANGLKLERVRDLRNVESQGSTFQVHTTSNKDLKIQL